MPRTVTALLLLSFAAIACGRQESAYTAPAPQGATTSPDAAGARFDPRAAQATAPPDAIGLVQKDVQVALVDYGIQMTDTLRPGQVTFNITNSGSRDHSFEIEGGGLEKKLDRPLRPGQSAQLETDLKSGTYTIYCPVADHDDRGMTRQLVVR